MVDSARLQPKSSSARPRRTLRAPDLPALSVIIPTWQRAETLRRCLRALARQTLPAAQWELLVCDDGSTDGTAGVLRELASTLPMQVFTQPQRGPAAARNLALGHARGDLVLFLNDDTILAKDGLASHLAVHAERGRSRIAVLGTFSLLPEHVRTPFARLLQDGDLLFHFRDMRPGGQYGWERFYTCNLSVRRTAVLKAGGFDEDFALPAAEDLELGVRLRRHGFRVRFEPRCQAWHDHPLSVRDFCRLHRARGHGAVSLFLKHRETCWMDRGWLHELARAAHETEGERQVHAALVEPVVIGIQQLSDSAAEDTLCEQERIAARLLPWARFLETVCSRAGHLSHHRLYELTENAV